VLPGTARRFGSKPANRFGVPVAWKIRGSVAIITIRARANNDLRRALIEAMSSPRLSSESAILLDLRLATENPTPDVLRRRAGWIGTSFSHRADSRCALVAGTRPHQYGLARMLAVFVQTEGINAEVFTRIKEACRWLTAADARKSGRADVRSASSRR
jgi:hypothetical protein